MKLRLAVNTQKEPKMADRFDRRGFHKAAGLGAVSLATAGFRPSSALGAGEADRFRVESGVRQLFLDDVGIERIEGLRRVVNKPARHPENPLLVPDTHWERGCQVYGTAYYDEAAGLFKLWYLTGPKDRGLRWNSLDEIRCESGHSEVLRYEPECALRPSYQEVCGLQSLWIRTPTGSK
ncbi:MAG: twin-arginine translocation signal domain-containing protein [Pirellulaceae bacterium]